MPWNSFRNNPKFEIKTCNIEYYEKAFGLLKKEVITELTWKVLLKLSQVYFNRGDLKKAKEFSHLWQEINFSYFK